MKSTSQMKLLRLSTMLPDSEKCRNLRQRTKREPIQKMLISSSVGFRWRSVVTIDRNCQGPIVGRHVQNAKAASVDCQKSICKDIGARIVAIHRRKCAKTSR